MRRSSSSAAEGTRFVTTLRPSRVTMPVSRPCSSRPPLRLRISARVLLGALGGGLLLERLYRRGMVRYRLIVARRPEAETHPH